MTSLLRTIFQVLFFIILSKIADFIVEFLHMPIPSSVVGIAILFSLLKTRIIRIEWVEIGAAWLLAEMLLFFIPSTVGIINYKDLVMSSGLQILIVILGSAVTVMLCSGAVAEYLSKRASANKEAEH